jgi:hypothetical protein
MRRLALPHNRWRLFVSDGLAARGHVPAPRASIIQTVTRGEELGLVGSKIAEEPAFYFKAARPPVLKDFFDPKIRKVLQVPKMLRMVEVSFETSVMDVVDFANAG